MKGAVAVCYVLVALGMTSSICGSVAPEKQTGQLAAVAFVFALLWPVWFGASILDGQVKSPSQQEGNQG